MSEAEKKLHNISNASTFAVELDSILHLVEELANKVLEAEPVEDDNETFQSLARAIIELENERSSLHSELEIETIKASVNRYLLQVLPQKYKKLMHDAVLAARNVNLSQMKILQKKLKTSTLDMKSTDETQKSLQKENLRMMPERHTVTRQHDEIIAQLNQRMAEKASKQIRLNETKDILNDTMASAGEFDVGIQNVEEDMAEFHKKCDAERNELLQEKAALNEKIATQKKKTAEEKKVTDGILDEIMDCTARINEVQREIRRTESNLARLEVQSMQSKVKLDTEKIENQNTREEIEILTSTYERHKNAYNLQISEIQEKNKAVSEDVAVVEAEFNKLDNMKNHAYVNLQEHKRQKEQAALRVKEYAMRLQKIKAKTTDCIEQTAHQKQSISNLQESLVQLDENHKATVETFNMQIHDYNENLNQEKSERLKVQNESEETDRQLETYRQEQVKFMNIMTSKIEEGRRKHQDLVKQKAAFNDDILTNNKRIDGLEVDIEIALRSFDNMKSELSMDIERTKTAIDMFQTEIKTKSQYLEDKKPMLHNLADEVQDVGEEFAFAKNEVVAIRNREKSLQEQLNRSNIMLSRLIQPQEKLKISIKKSQEQGVLQLREHADERKTLEAEIYSDTHKMEHIASANEKFNQENTKIHDAIDELAKDMESHTTHQENLLLKLGNLRNHFLTLWAEGEELEKQACADDMNILHEINKLQDETKKRGEKLTSIANNLQNEMQMLTGFLENVNSRRPKDTRQSRRVSIKHDRKKSRASLGSKISVLTGLPQIQSRPLFQSKQSLSSRTRMPVHTPSSLQRPSLYEIA